MITFIVGVVILCLVCMNKIILMGRDSVVYSVLGSVFAIVYCIWWYNGYSLA